MDELKEGKWCAFLPMFSQIVISCFMAFSCNKVSIQAVSWLREQGALHQTLHGFLLSVTGKWKKFRRPSQMRFELFKRPQETSEKSKPWKSYGTLTYQMVRNFWFAFSEFSPSPLTNDDCILRSPKRGKKFIWGSGTVSCYTDCVCVVQARKSVQEYVPVNLRWVYEMETIMKYVLTLPACLIVLVEIKTSVQCNLLGRKFVFCFFFLRWETSMCSEVEYFVLCFLPKNFHFTKWPSAWSMSFGCFILLWVSFVSRSASGRRLKRRRGPCIAESLRLGDQAQEDLDMLLLTKKAMESLSHLEKICVLKIYLQHQGWKRHHLIALVGLKIYVRKPQTQWAALARIKQWNCESRWIWTTLLSFHFTWSWNKLAPEFGIRV